MSTTTPSRTPESRRKPASERLPIATICLVVGGSLVGWALIDHVNQLNERIAEAKADEQRATAEARRQAARADQAVQEAREADEARQQAEAEAETARGQSATAIELAAEAQEQSLASQAAARRAQEQAEARRQAAEAEMNRLSAALGRIAETRRTALGLVMSLDEGSLKFDFDRADLRPESRETLSLIAGILFTSDDFAITVSGHTDARGSAEYNQRLSERRARAVADYLIGAGLARERFTVEGLGKAHPLDTGDSDEAHARNRRVELGIVSARIIDPRQVGP